MSLIANSTLSKKITLISDTIKKLRTENALTQVEFAKKLNCNRQKIADWERGKSTPSADDIILLCEKFGVSADYLLGQTTAKTTDKDLQFVCNYLGLTEKTAEMLRASHQKAKIEKLIAIMEVSE